MKQMKLPELQLEMMNILKYIDKICSDYNIKYSLIGGSLIGAIRHKNIIPWDDDIDIALERSEYEKLIKILHKTENSKYKLLNWKYSKDYNCYWSKVINTETMVIETGAKVSKDYGVFLDIFPYDKIPNSNKKIFYIKKKIIFSFVKGLSFDTEYKYTKNYLLKKIRFYISSKILKRERILNLYDRFCQKYNKQKNNNYLTSAYVNPKLKIINKNDFNELIEVKFANLKVKIFKNYDRILKEYFGNYMKLPPKSERKTHGLIAYWRNNYEKEK